MADFGLGNLNVDTFLARNAVSSIGVTSVSLDSDTDYVWWTFLAEAAMTIDRLGFRCTSQQGTPASIGNYTISLMDVSGTNGGPGATTHASESFSGATGGSPAIAANTFVWITLSTPYACSRGQLMGIKLKQDVTDAVNFLSVGIGYASAARTVLPQAMTNTGSLSKSPTTLPVYGYGTSSKRYGNPIASALAETDFSSDDEQGILFSLPAGWGATYKVVGIEMYIHSPAAAKTIQLQLTDNAATPNSMQLSAALDTDVLGSTANVIAVRLIFADATLDALSFGTEYVAGLVMGGASENSAIDYFTVSSDDDRTAFPYNNIFKWVSRTAADAAWTENTKRIPCCRLLLDDWTEPAAGGGAQVIGS